MGVTRNRKQTDALAVLISICLLVALTGCGKKEERPLTEQAFYEEALVLGDLTQEEKAAIEELLKSSYIEDEESAGFCFADAQIAGGFDLAGRIAEAEFRLIGVLAVDHDRVDRRHADKIRHDIVSG